MLAYSYLWDYSFYLVVQCKEDDSIMGNELNPASFYRERFAASKLHGVRYLKVQGRRLARLATYATEGAAGRDRLRQSSYQCSALYRA